MLKKIRDMLGLSALPSEMESLYRDARDEREALNLLREARHRDEQRRNRAMEDILILEEKEQELFEQGKQEASETRKKLLAKRVRQIRDKIAEINHKIDNIFEKRIKIYAEHIRALETIVDLAREPLPDTKALEEVVVRARERLEQLDKTHTLAEGLTPEEQALSLTAEEQAIMEEFERGSETEAPQGDQVEAAPEEERPREQEEALAEPDSEEPERELLEE